MRKIQHIFFDLDRTLWDFDKNSETALRLLFEKYKLSEYIFDFDTFHKKYKAVNASYWEDYSLQKITKEKLRIVRFRDTLVYFGLNSEKLAQQLSEGYVKISPLQKNLFPNTIETLEELKSLNLPLHIITNGFKEVQYIKLKNCGLDVYFDSVLCSEEVGFNKPDPRIFYHALNTNKASASRALMIGDDFKTDIIGAEKAGIASVLFDPHQQFQERIEIDKITDLNQLPSRILGL